MRKFKEKLRKIFVNLSSKKEEITLPFCKECHAPIYIGLCTFGCSLDAEDQRSAEKIEHRIFRRVA